MTNYEMSSTRDVGVKLARPVELTCFALLVSNLVYIVVACVQSSWLTTPDSATDFVTLWAAGRLAISADGFFHCRPFVAIALCERFCPLGVRHIPGLPGGNSLHE